MKNILIVFFLILAYVSSKAQNMSLKGQIIPPHASVIVDSIPIEFNTLKLVDTSSIKSINVVSNKGYTDAVVYVTLKDHNYSKNLIRAKKLSLKELTERYVSKADKSKPIIYIIDYGLLMDTTGVRIPSERFYNVSVTKASETPYLKLAFPDAILFKVFTMIFVR